MIKIKSKSSINYDGFRKLKKQIESKIVQVGYIDSPKHWSSDILSVAEVASILHYDSPWGRDNMNGGFMISEYTTDSTKKVVSYNLSAMFGTTPFVSVLDKIGEDLAETIKVRITQTDSPVNSEKWAKQKGFNDPLVYGSAIGQTPNLISEIKFKIVGVNSG